METLASNKVCNSPHSLRHLDLGIGYNPHKTGLEDIDALSTKQNGIIIVFPLPLLLLSVQDHVLLPLVTEEEEEEEKENPYLVVHPNYVVES